MNEALSDPRNAPFARTSARGFLFRTLTFRRGLLALQRTWTEHSFPIVLQGPEGLGKKTLVSAWLHGQPRGTITAARLSAENLQPWQAAEEVLMAFGQKPSPSASAEDALCDFLEDCVFDGRPAFVMISDLQRAPRGLWSELQRLVLPRAEGGVGLPLCVTTARAPLGTETVMLPSMGSSEISQFVFSVLDAAKEPTSWVSDGVLTELAETSRGLPAVLGPALDEAWLEEQASIAASRSSDDLPADDEFEPIDPPPAPQPTEMTPAEALARMPQTRGRIVKASPSPEPSGNPENVPSPKDIEAALLALEADETALAIGQTALETAPDLEEQAREAPRHRDFPTIATGARASSTGTPANDPVELLAPRIAEGLEGVAAEVAGLQGHLIVVRGHAEALRSRFEERAELRSKAAEDFAESLKEIGG
ncbi:MAG: hypothetical protein AAGG79_00455 [Pseudomonadota bacterium]